MIAAPPQQRHAHAPFRPSAAGVAVRVYVSAFLLLAVGVLPPLLRDGRNRAVALAAI